jgi:hypothetical protein
LINNKDIRIRLGKLKGSKKTCRSGTNNNHIDHTIMVSALLLFTLYGSSLGHNCHRWCVLHVKSFKRIAALAVWAKRSERGITDIGFANEEPRKHLYSPESANRQKLKGAPALVASQDMEALYQESEMEKLEGISTSSIKFSGRGDKPMCILSRFTNFDNIAKIYII